MIDKPPLWTSNDVVSKLKGVLKERRIGHSGTLDPLATGLLVVFAGRATRAVSFAESHDKRYTAGLRLGLRTDTQDISGNVISQEQTDIKDEELDRVLSCFVGEIEQTPPMYSAVRVNGKRLYELARKGIEVERKPRKITVYSIERKGRESGDIVLDIKCSKGTYIRTLCSDIGERLGCGACMSTLRRTEAGMFSVENAYTLDEVIREAEIGDVSSLILPTETIFSEYERITVSASAEAKVRNGNPVSFSAQDGTYRVCSQQGEFLALGRCENGIIKTIKSFFEV
ncbi:MAG: tRNA pseudouridine(55) synthase TruB [Oscillospiraceae bacterium]|nr:tRNA pseudouridine(55) synthase TruB [Oscillospiraceae bacterium]